jgi:hypothetical protein
MYVLSTTRDYRKFGTVDNRRNTKAYGEARLLFNHMWPSNLQQIVNLRQARCHRESETPSRFTVLQTFIQCEA